MYHKTVRRLCASLLALTLVVDVSQGATRSEPSVLLQPCALPDVTRAARCGVLEVPENPGKPGGRRIAIGIVVIPAADGPAQPDPIVVLMGGPGEDAISAAAIFAELFAPALRDRDLLLVDQRGTGRSNALNCDLLAGEDPAVPLRDLFPP
jgi:pimeloyl-ACP methyl ester carboxylesterase